MTDVLVDEPTDAAVGAIGRQAMRGLSWSLGGTALSKMGGLVLGLILARLLAPTEFGLYAVAIAATQFVMVIKDLGVIAATMHWRWASRGDDADSVEHRVCVQHCSLRHLLDRCPGVLRARG